MSGSFYFLRGLAIGLFVCTLFMAVYGFLCTARGYLSEGRDCRRQFGFGALWLLGAVGALALGVGAAVLADQLR